ncbi:hypothetical protein GMRT_11144 [Giardia muris]|uniref:Uncharacterized protein n=1 Tax=Giardia muris TaxID=5742 RepID=A0A4Z1SU46_GIAMU|nr:hypothetical protein GMRT_11144 [Giardia muris]|eukprot:TNJ29374.1 hypothetical protein GMRT_11144 [Giardia muris]
MLPFHASMRPVAVGCAEEGYALLSSTTLFVCAPVDVADEEPPSPDIKWQARLPALISSGIIQWPFLVLGSTDQIVVWEILDAQTPREVVRLHSTHKVEFLCRCQETQNIFACSQRGLWTLWKRGEKGYDIARTGVCLSKVYGCAIQKEQLAIWSSQGLWLGCEQLTTIPFEAHDGFNFGDAKGFWFGSSFTLLAPSGSYLFHEDGTITRTDFQGRISEDLNGHRVIDVTTGSRTETEWKILAYTETTMMMLSSTGRDARCDVDEPGPMTHAALVGSNAVMCQYASGTLIYADFEQRRAIPLYVEAVGKVNEFIGFRGPCCGDTLHLGFVTDDALHILFETPNTHSQLLDVIPLTARAEATVVGTQKRILAAHELLWYDEDFVYCPADGEAQRLKLTQQSTNALRSIFYLEPRRYALVTAELILDVVIGPDGFLVKRQIDHQLDRFDSKVVSHMCENSVHYITVLIQSEQMFQPLVYQLPPLDSDEPFTGNPGLPLAGFPLTDERLDDLALYSLTSDTSMFAIISERGRLYYDVEKGDETSLRTHVLFNDTENLIWRYCIYEGEVSCLTSRGALIRFDIQTETSQTYRGTLPAEPLALVHIQDGLLVHIEEQIYRIHIRGDSYELNALDRPGVKLLRPLSPTHALVGAQVDSLGFVFYRVSLTGGSEYCLVDPRTAHAGRVTLPENSQVILGQDSMLIVTEKNIFLYLISLRSLAFELEHELKKVGKNNTSNDPVRTDQDEFQRLRKVRKCTLPDTARPRDNMTAYMVWMTPEYTGKIYRRRQHEEESEPQKYARAFGVLVFDESTRQVCLIALVLDLVGLRKDDFLDDFVQYLCVQKPTEAFCPLEITENQCTIPLQLRLNDTVPFLGQVGSKIIAVSLRGIVFVIAFPPNSQSFEPFIQGNINVADMIPKELGFQSIACIQRSSHLVDESSFCVIARCGVQEAGANAGAYYLVRVGVSSPLVMGYCISLLLLPIGAPRHLCCKGDRAIVADKMHVVVVDVATPLVLRRHAFAHPVAGVYWDGDEVWVCLETSEVYRLCL